MELSIGRMELALLRASLDAFTLRFYQKAGSMYIRFDAARAESARLRSSSDPSADKDYLAAQEQWRLSKADSTRALARPPADPERLRQLHRELARMFHPDLALDPVRRRLCEQLMVEVNTAVQDGDHARLDAIRGTIQGGSDAAAEMAELTRGIAFQLNARNQYALRQQDDLLTQLTDWLYAQAAQAKRHETHQGTAQLYANLMTRAMVDLQSVSVRLLRFPKDTSLGQLIVRAERNIDSPRAVLGEARGAVKVPFGRATILQLGAETRSLEALRTLDAEDINGLIVPATLAGKVGDDFLQPLSVFNRLEELQLSATHVTGRLLDDFPVPRELRLLDVARTEFDDHGVERLEQSVWLQRLDLSSTRATGSTLRSLHRMKSLRALSLYGTPVRDADLEVLAALPSLRDLNLGLTAITDAALARVVACPQLEVLHLGGTAVTDAAVEAIIAMPAVRDLTLWETAISDEALLRLAHCTTLRYLDVDQTQVRESGLAEFRRLRPDIRMPSDIG